MLIPLKDENPTRITPYVTFVIIGLNLLGFFMELQAPTALARQKLIFGMGAIPVRFFREFGSLPDFYLPVWMTVFTSLFLHAGWIHLGGNMLYLWIFGNNVEEYLGHVRFAVFYLLSGVVATWAHILVASSSQVPLIGASGAIAGVLGAYLFLYPRHQVLCLAFLFFFIQVIRIPALWVLGFWFVIQLFQGTISLGSAGAGGVAWFAHIGGFLTGLLLIRMSWKFGWNAYRR
ncbi:MAG: rhomboid family intramembrane serine protease, partial [Nitrospinota bacterium]